MIVKNVLIVIALYPLLPPTAKCRSASLTDRNHSRYARNVICTNELSRRLLLRTPNCSPPAYQPKNAPGGSGHIGRPGLGPTSDKGPFATGSRQQRARPCPLCPESGSNFRARLRWAIAHRGIPRLRVRSFHSHPRRQALRACAGNDGCRIIRRPSTPAARP
jgi:hypothetical protein